MSLLSIEDQKENYMAIAAGDGAYRGMITGALAGVGGLLFIFLTIFNALNGDMQTALETGVVALLLFLLPFMWETLRPLPLPILFNRRTQEVYFQHEDDLYHTPWEGITATAYQFEMVGPNSGLTRHAALEVLVQNFENSENQIFVSVGLPMGKSLDMQKSCWEYIRAYMNNGPWFDENGNNCKPKDFINSQLQIGENAGKIVRTIWNRICDEYKSSNGKNFLDIGDVFMAISALALLPMNSIHELTYRVAKLHSRKQWVHVVAERLKQDGPTTPLIDIQKTNQKESI